MNTTRCEGCGGKFDALSRQATQNAMGPWWVRDTERPFRPGCAYETIRSMVGKGLITGQTVLRGPTTRQFWKHARRVPGVAHLLGVCHACQRDVSPEAFMCPACGASFVAETDRQHLGLSAVSLLPGQAPAEKIAAVSVPTGAGGAAGGSLGLGAGSGSLAGALGSVLDEPAGFGAAAPILGPAAPVGRALRSGDAMHEALASVRSVEHGAGGAEHPRHHHRRRHGPSPVAMVAFFVLGVVLTVCGVGVPLVVAQGGVEEALAALGLGEGGGVARAGGTDASDGAGGPGDSSVTGVTGAVAERGAANAGGPIVDAGESESGDGAGASSARTEGAELEPATTAVAEDALASVLELLGKADRDSLRDALRTLERLVRDGGVAETEAASWRRAIEARLARESLAGLP